MKESSWSPCKKTEFRRVLMQIGSAVGKIRYKYVHNNWYKAPERLLYIDLNAGDGGHPGGWGSPVMAIEILDDIREEDGLGYDVHLYEKEPKEYERLEIVLGESLTNPPKGCTVTLHKCDNSDVVNLQIPDPAWGMVYADPYGNCEFVSILIALAADKRYRKMDFLVNLNPASIKRVNGVSHKCTDCMYGDSIASCLGNINKKFIKVREPDKGETHSMWQWTYTLLTNTSNIFDLSWKQHKWYNMADSLARIEELSKTNKELARAK